MDFILGAGVFCVTRIKKNSIYKRKEDKLGFLVGLDKKDYIFALIKINLFLCGCFV